MTCFATWQLVGSCCLHSTSLFKRTNWHPVLWWFHGNDGWWRKKSRELFFEASKSSWPCNKKPECATCVNVDEKRERETAPVLPVFKKAAPTLPALCCLSLSDRRVTSWSKLPCEHFDFFPPHSRTQTHFPPLPAARTTFFFHLKEAAILTLTLKHRFLEVSFWTKLGNQNMLMRTSHQLKRNILRKKPTETFQTSDTLIN